MWIGAAKLVLDFYGNEKIALKRKLLEELSKEIRRKFNLSMMEVADFDDTERCIVGFSLVMPAHWKKSKCTEFVTKVCKAIDQTSFARVVSEDVQLYSID